MMIPFDINKCVILSKDIRKNALRMTSVGKSSHVGSVFSTADILAVLYGSFLNIDPMDPKKSNRDRFILSKGHAGAGVYAALAQIGFFDKSLLDTHYQNGSSLSGHISHKGIPGVELSTGSLGHGLAVGVGIALSAKLKKNEFKTVVLMSDGECDEGSNWEAILIASHNRLDNMIAIVDYNKLQSIKSTSETLNLEPFADKWRSFGWKVLEVDGHNHFEIHNALTQVFLDQPLCIIAHTIKGKGVTFMENKVIWHYKSAVGKDYSDAMQELDF